ncbi:MAG: lytic transglycosylase, partial [Mangrovicoccus sp.]
MSRYWLALGLCIFLAACGGSKAPPSNLDNACSIVAQRPSFLRAMKRTERRWGAPVHVQMAFFHQESRFNGK